MPRTVIKLRALRPMTVEGEDVPKGAKFETTDAKLARMLMSIGKAELATVEDKKRTSAPAPEPRAPKK